LPTPADADQAVLETAAQILRCNGCGAAVEYDAKIQAPRCGFCASVMEIEVPEDPVEQAQRYLRFRVTPDQAKGALKNWLGTLGFFRPSDLQKRAAVDSLKPLWWVGWMFDADVHMTWAADSDAGAGRSAWAPHSGGADLQLRRVVVPASRGLTEAECQQLIGAYDVSNAAEQPEGAAAGTSVEQFTLQRSSARRLLSGALRNVAAQHATGMIPGSTYRNLHVAVLPTKLTTERLAFPAYVLAYRYGDKLYRAVIHGHDPKVVLADAPLSFARIFAVVGAVIGVVLAIYLVLVLVNA
jgi:hypothetical protein